MLSWVSPCFTNRNLALSPKLVAGSADTPWSFTMFHLWTVSSYPAEREPLKPTVNPHEVQHQHVKKCIATTIYYKPSRTTRKIHCKHLLCHSRSIRDTRILKARCGETSQVVHVFFLLYPRVICYISIGVLPTKKPLNILILCDSP